MSNIPGPSVAPQYYGGDVGERIADAFYRQAELSRQRDLDAIETGVGLQRGDTVTSPSVGFGDRIRQAFQRMTGQGAQATPAQIDATRSTLNTLATNQAAANNASLEGRPQPGNVAAGSYAPSGIPDTLRLPSGKTVPTMFTPFGQRLMQAQLQREFNAAMLGERLDTQRDVAHIRAQGQLDVADRRASDMANVVIPARQQAAVTTFQQQLPAREVLKQTGLAPNSAMYREDPAHRDARQNFNAVESQLHDATGQLRSVDATLSKPLSPLATSADSAQRQALTTQRGTLAGRVDLLRHLGDSLSTAMRGGAGSLGPLPGTTTASTAATSPRGDDGSAAEYEAAARAFTAAGGPSNANARAVYNRVVGAIAAKYGHAQPGTN